MFKKFNGYLVKNTKSCFNQINFHMYKTFPFSRKNTKPIQVSEPLDPNIETDEYIDEQGNKLNYVKVFHGIYPYLPLDDHPLIPGYARIIALTREITEKLKALNAEKTKLVIFVLKNPDKVEALQATM